MRIFISYSSRFRDLCESLRLTLEGEGHEAFVDRVELEAGQPFDAKLRNAINRCDLFIFLISPETVALGSYALAELSLAEQRWRHPAGRVLPVMVASTPKDSIPPYLRAVTILDPKGDAVAETAAAVRRFARLPKRRVAMLGASFIAVVVLAMAGYWQWQQREIAPFTAPFVEASSQYRSAVVASGAVLDAELIDIGAEQEAAAFGKEWAIRVRATDALVSYSQALKSIVASGAQGSQSARSVADAVTALASAVRVALPPAAKVDTVTEAAAFVYGQIAAVRASAALGDALRNATPAIDRIATIMGSDLNSAQDIFDAANIQAKTRLVMRHSVESAYLESLRDERLAISRKPVRTSTDEERLLQIDRLEESSRSWREPMEAHKRALAARRKAGDQLFVSARGALDAWALAHRDLAAAVESGRKVDVTALVASVEGMRELIKRIQAL